MTRPRTTIMIGGILAAVIAVRFVFPAHSYSITGGVQKVTVYDGVMTVSPFTGPGQPVLEFGVNGASGMDIASSSPDIVLRPDSSNTTTTKFSGSTGNVQNLTLSGDLILSTSGRTVCVKSLCRTGWVGGLENWKQHDVSYADGSFSYSFLEPVNLDHGVRIGDSDRPVTSGTALSADGLFVTNRGTGYAAQFTGNVFDIGNLSVTKGIFINNTQTWSQWNDGLNSGLDADRLDGMDTTLRNGYACDATTCVCVTGQSANHPGVRTNDLRCIRLFVTSSPEAPY